MEETEVSELRLGSGVEETERSEVKVSGLVWTLDFGVELSDVFLFVEKEKRKNGGILHPTVRSVVPGGTLDFGLSLTWPGFGNVFQSLEMK